MCSEWKDAQKAWAELRCKETTKGLVCTSQRDALGAASHQAIFKKYLKVEMAGEFKSTNYT